MELAEVARAPAQTSEELEELGGLLRPKHDEAPEAPDSDTQAKREQDEALGPQAIASDQPEEAASDQMQLLSADSGAPETAQCQSFRRLFLWLAVVVLAAGAAVGLASWLAAGSPDAATAAPTPSLNRPAAPTAAPTPSSGSTTSNTDNCASGDSCEPNTTEPNSTASNGTDCLNSSGAAITLVFEVRVSAARYAGSPNNISARVLGSAGWSPQIPLGGDWSAGESRTRYAESHDIGPAVLVELASSGKNGWRLDELVLTRGHCPPQSFTTTKWLGSGGRAQLNLTKANSESTPTTPGPAPSPA